MRKDLVTTITKKRLLWSVPGFILGLVFLSIDVVDEGSYTNTIMHPDRETRHRWIESYERVPLARIDDELKFRVPLRGSLSLLSRLDYTPSERDQRETFEKRPLLPHLGVRLKFHPTRNIQYIPVVEIFAFLDLEQN